MRCLTTLPIAFFSTLAFAQSDIQSLGELPAQISETSGLIFYKGKMITHNDSNGLPELYEIDTLSLSIERTVIVQNATNIDWEAITQDDEFIYVGDIGNNTGNRQDLRILKIKKSDYDQFDTVGAETIDFLYEDQENFESVVNGSDFDAEALFSLGDNLFILTKQWQSGGTVAYRLPKFPGAFLAERIDEYQVGGLVTGASYDTNLNELYLIGYSRFLNPFFVEIKEVEMEAIFSNDTNRTDLDLGFAQTEGLTKVNNTFYISSEAVENSNLSISSASQLFRFSLDDMEQNEEMSEEPAPALGNDLILYRALGSERLYYQLSGRLPIFGRGIFDSMGRLIDFNPLENFNENWIDLSKFRPAVYHLGFFYGDRIVSKPFILNR